MVTHTHTHTHTLVLLSCFSTTIPGHVALLDMEGASFTEFTSHVPGEVVVSTCGLRGHPCS